MSNTENIKTLPIIASIITILNFIVSIGYPLNANYSIALGDAFNSLFANSIVLKIIIFLILEYILSLAIINMMILVGKDKYGSFSWFGVVILAIISAWTSIFNSKYIFFYNLDVGSGNVSVFKIILAMIIANIIFTGVSVDYTEDNEEIDLGAVFICHGIVLFLIFLFIYNSGEI